MKLVLLMTFLCSLNTYAVCSLESQINFKNRSFLENIKNQFQRAKYNLFDKPNSKNINQEKGISSLNDQLFPIEQVKLDNCPSKSTFYKFFEDHFNDESIRPQGVVEYSPNKLAVSWYSREKEKNTYSNKDSDLGIFITLIDLESKNYRVLKPSISGKPIKGHAGGMSYFENFLIVTHYEKGVIFIDLNSYKTSLVDLSGFDLNLRFSYISKVSDDTYITGDYSYFSDDQLFYIWKVTFDESSENFKVSLESTKKRRVPLGVQGVLLNPSSKSMYFSVQNDKEHSYLTDSNRAIVNFPPGSEDLSWAYEDYQSFWTVTEFKGMRYLIKTSLR